MDACSTSCNCAGGAANPCVEERKSILDRQRACRPAQSALSEPQGCRDSPADWTDGALLGTWCGATGPQAPAEPVKVETGPNPAPESATAPAKQPPQEPTEFRDRDCPAWVHFPAPDWAVRRSWPMAHTWRWLRTISSPPEMAGVAIRGSAMSLRARISNLGPAFATKISPSSLER